jgi:hypothetical protein
LTLISNRRGWNEHPLARRWKLHPPSELETCIAAADASGADLVVEFAGLL